MICGYTKCPNYWTQLSNGCECAETCPGYIEQEEDNKQHSGLLEEE